MHMHLFQEEEHLLPLGDLALQITALPCNTNGFGNIFGGWLVSQMDIAGTSVACKIAKGPIAAVAIDQMSFLIPIAVGSQLSFYTQVLSVGRSSIQVRVEVWSEDILTDDWRKVTESTFIFVAVDSNGRTRNLTPRQ